MSKSRLAAALASVLLAAGCAHSPTEADFGNSVRNVIQKQQVGSGGPLRPDQPLETTDGRRMESVTRVYQTNVGDPSAVVTTKEVSSGGNQQ